jgi:hypothetical protein
VKEGMNIIRVAIALLVRFVNKKTNQTRVSYPGYRLPPDGLSNARALKQSNNFRNGARKKFYSFTVWDPAAFLNFITH